MDSYRRSEVSPVAVVVVFFMKQDEKSAASLKADG
jgi:hypothetical protein